MKTKNCIENKDLLIPLTIAEEIDNENCNEGFSEVRENHILIALDKISDRLGEKYPVIKDDLLYKHQQKLEERAIKENTFQHCSNLRQREGFKKVIIL